MKKLKKTIKRMKTTKMYEIGSYEQSALASTAILKSALALSMSSMSVLFTLKASSNVESYESIHKFLEPLCTLRGNF